jgi:hypothetical protein
MIRRLLTVACVLAWMGSLAAFAEDPPRTISAISDRLYVASAGTESTVVLVSAGGILVADPLDLATASWLRTELSTRFPGVPVRYVVVTSARFGRASGVRMFLPAASVVAHAGVNGALVQASREIPPELTSLDANRSGRLEADEWTPLEAFVPFKSLDTDGNVSLTSREVWKLIPYTENTFTHEKVLTLGDDAVRLVDPGEDGSTPAIYFPGERVLYTGSNPLVTMKGFTLTLAGRARTFAWLDGISRLEFDRIITSHGEAVPRAQFDLVVRYAHALERAAVEAYRRGQSEGRRCSPGSLHHPQGAPTCPPSSERSIDGGLTFRAQLLSAASPRARPTVRASPRA